MRTAMTVVVKSRTTEEVIKAFKGVELQMGNQYWMGWCLGQNLIVDKIERTYSTVTYWVC